MGTLAPVTERALELAEVAACRSYGSAVTPGVARDLGLQLLALGSAIAVRVAAVDILAYNRVLGLGVGEPATERRIDEALAFFRAAGVPRCMVNVAPGTSPEALTAWLSARGFSPHNHWLRLYRTLARVDPPADPRIRPIGPEHAETFARTDVEAFGHPASLIPWLARTVARPGWHHFGAFEGDQPVGFGALFVDGRVAWFGFACTRAEFRGRGIQSSLIATRLHAAAELRCDLVAVETADDTPEKPNPSTHNLRRAGFADGYRRANWVLKLAPSPGGAGSAGAAHGCA